MSPNYIFLPDSSGDQRKPAIIVLADGHFIYQLLVESGIPLPGKTISLEFRMEFHGNSNTIVT